MVGAVLLATENAPEGKRAWYGIPATWCTNWLHSGNRLILTLGAFMSEAEFMQWGWRIPFISSALLVIMGLWIRLKLHETPAFQNVLKSRKK